MGQIVISGDQARLLAESYPVAVVDEHGNVLGYVEPIGFTAEEIASAKKRAKDSRSWYPGAEVAAHLAAMEKAVEAEGVVDKDGLREVLAAARTQSQK